MSNKSRRRDVWWSLCQLCKQPSPCERNNNNIHEPSPRQLICPSSVSTRRSATEEVLPVAHLGRREEGAKADHGGDPIPNFFVVRCDVVPYSITEECGNIPPQLWLQWHGQSGERRTVTKPNCPDAIWARVAGRFSFSTRSSHFLFHPRPNGSVVNQLPPMKWWQKDSACCLALS